jgi:hypothetical protein
MNSPSGNQDAEHGDTQADISRGHRRDPWTEVTPPIVKLRRNDLEAQTIEQIGDELD